MLASLLLDKREAVAYVEAARVRPCTRFIRHYKEGTVMNDFSKRSSQALSRREILAYSAAFGGSFLAAQGLLAADDAAAVAKPAGQPVTPRYDMKKSINLWALPYPQKMTLRESLMICRDAGFDGVELNYALEGELSSESSEEDIRAVGKMVRDIGLDVSGVCSFLFWPYSFTHNDPERRARGRELAGRMIRAAELLETPNLLVVPGAVYAPWLPDEPPVKPDACYRRAHDAVASLVPAAEKAGVYLNIENIFANGFLHSPQEMIGFVDSFGSKHVAVHFDTGNIMQYHFPEHWIPLLGHRIRNVHLKEYSKRDHEFGLNAFRPLLDGTTDWPAVLESLDAVGYRGYLTFEYFNPYRHWPEALVHHTSDSLDRMLGRKAAFGPPAERGAASQHSRSHDRG
ncbi:MAG: sugar phosphate isomerase/epimerase family protein [Patescibacteria group bacterium]|nr:sugar phosphate isomerase/epimerase family protein [Patescibacteria group bacterium]